MHFDQEKQQIYMPVQELASFAYPSASAVPGMGPDSFQKHDSTASAAETAVPMDCVLEHTKSCPFFSVCVQGTPEQILYNGTLYIAEHIQTVSYFRYGFNPFQNIEKFAQAALHAYLFAVSRNLPQIVLRISFLKRNDDQKISFDAVCSRQNLAGLFELLLKRAQPFLQVFTERYTVFAEEVRHMPFPYHTIREGQNDFIQTAFRTIRRGDSLLVSAPTGIGKTISSLFPAVKALASGSADRIFYLTAKTITGQTAVEAVQRMARYAPHLRAVMIGAREQICPYQRKQYAFCRSCDKTDSNSPDFGKTYISFRERELAALASLLYSTETVYTMERIRKTAEEHNVCPYELALSLSEFCMILICDYNYVIDDQIRFRRYFKNISNTEKYVFLFDEAHNLPDRTRNTYSSRITLDSAESLIRICGTNFPDQPDLLSRAEEYRDALTAVRSLCTEFESTRISKDGEEIHYGYYEANRIPDSLVRTLGNLARLLSALLRSDADGAELLEPYSRELSKAAFSFSFFDKKFRFFAAREQEKVTAQVLCLDPSGILGNMLASARSSILFSATLSPMEYFSHVTGLTQAEQLELVSPYEKNNLCLVAYDSISTRLADRKNTAYACAEIIAETVSAREGNYLIYFPSYAYMKQVCQAFASMAPDCSMVMQKPGMSYRERERFISLFREQNHTSIVGFCVLGGMFSEGIDLAGESLIGVMVFGIGMPQISAERNIMAAYYEDLAEQGQAFAYICPGMNKVMQAAGRVIRSEKDRGIVVLVDDRLQDPNIHKLFPAHWKHMKYTSNTASLRQILRSFWQEN